MTPVTIALAMFVVGGVLLREPVFYDLAELITLLFATVLIWGANAILLTRAWLCWRRSRHDA
jgi:hypothetical protein